MKLVDALNVLKKPTPEGTASWDLALVCGFTPAHLETFLAAHLRLLDPGRRAVIRTGLYGDCLGNFHRVLQSPNPPVAAAVVLEWADLDPRLGLRHRGGWGTRILADILETATARATRFLEVFTRISGTIPAVFCPPTLPVPPIAQLPVAQACSFDLGLREVVTTLSSRIARLSGVRIVNIQRLDQLSPPGDRLDVRTELSSGFPYRLTHASAVANLLARLLRSPVAKKGLITDLDDTLWSGVVGDVGVDGITWDIDHHSQIHALYQQLVGSLAETGILIAVASKNDPQVVHEALGRDDLAALRDRFFPLEVGWGPKSDAVSRILRAWNIGADSVVFVDDSAMELAEVNVVHPQVEGLLFPKNDHQAAYELLVQLRDLFGKERVSEEDAIRIESLRRSAEFFTETENQSAPADGFLELVDAEITVDFTKDPPNPRALELINKTNQFNLNGRRYTEGEWLAHLKDAETFLMLVAYKDKFGPLGTIAVMTGRFQNGTVIIEQWVMSCRAFARRIEHRCFTLLCEAFGAGELTFDFQVTPRNGPLREFLAGILDAEPESRLTITRDSFLAGCPPLYHRVKGQSSWAIHAPV